MPNFSYNTNIPNAPNNPSADQPLMQTNTNSISSIIAIDHTGFGINNGGTHQQVQLIEVTGVPSGLVGAGFETLYANIVAGNGEVFLTRGSSGTGIQLTGPGTPSSSFTFLPGGINIQWGTVNGTHGGNNHFNNQDTSTVTFGTAFKNNCFGVFFSTLYNTNTGSMPSVNGTVSYDQFTLSKTKFDWEFLNPGNSSQYVQFFWIAIGN